MSQNPTAPIQRHFATLKDPRMDRTREHNFLDIITIAICAAIGGADNWVDVAAFGRRKRKWFKKFLKLPNGIPSHDTFGRVFALIDADQFQACFLAWVQSAFEATKGQVVPIDGKTLRRSHDKSLGKEAIQMVSAWSTANHIVLGQKKVASKSNEITAIPDLLKVLELSGCIVTIDAIGCQKEIAEAIVKKGADYLLAVKENQGCLYEDIKELFDYALQENFKDVQHDYCKKVNGGHGRIEIRQCWTIDDPTFLAYIRNLLGWKNLKSIVMIVSERRVGDKVSVATRYYITSLASNAKCVLRARREHWSIENSLHWVLDIAFREDESRIRKGNGPQNFAVLRHIALNLLKQETTAQGGIKCKRLQAAWDEDYLLKVLLGD